MKKPKLGVLMLGVLLLTAQPSSAEQKSVPRAGQFALPGPKTPKCSDLAEGIVKYGSRGANYAADWMVDQGKAYADLVQGDPDAFVRQVSRTWDDIGTAATYVADQGGVFLPQIVAEEILGELLPGTGIQEFMRQGRKAMGSAQGAVVMTTLDEFEKDFSEVSNDLWDVIENIDDPEALAVALGDKMQKWNPAVSLTYVFTESDPLKGAEKAANRLLRQVDIMTTYIAPYAKAPAALAKGGAAVAAYNKLQKIPGMPGPSASNFDSRTRGIITKMIKGAVSKELEKTAREFGAQNSFNDQQRAAIEVFVATINEGMNEVTGEHPFYKTYLKIMQEGTEVEWMKDSFKDGGTAWGGWHPIVEDGNNCINLGDYVDNDRGRNIKGPGIQLKAVCGEEVTKGWNVWWTRPIDYELVWGDNCSGGRHDRSIWAPVCPNGYTNVGFVHWGGSWEKPLPNRIACLKEDRQLLYRADGATAGLQFRVDDAGTGAKYDLTVYNRKFAGIEMMYAVPFNFNNPNEYPQTIQVPVAWGEPGGHGPGYTYAGFKPEIQWTDARGDTDWDKYTRIRERKEARLKAAADARTAQQNLNLAGAALPTTDPQSTTRQYYVWQDNEAVGPYSQDFIIEIARANPLILQQFGWYEGLPDWQPLSQLFPGLVAAATQPVVAQNTGVNLGGHWTATYECLGSVTETVKITQQGQHVEAIKVTGDACVPAGYTSFFGSLSGNQGQLQCAIGWPDKPASAWMAGSLRVVDANSFEACRMLFTRATP